MGKIILGVLWGIVGSPAVLVCMALVGIATVYFLVTMFGATGGALVVPVAGP